MTALSEEGWAHLVLVDLGVPATANNEGNLMRWMTAEEPTADWYDRNNPLNSGAGTDSVSGLGTYPTLQVAASTDAAQITPVAAGGDDEAGYYTGIYTALKTNASTGTFAQAVMASPWASSHYAGNPIDQIAVPAGTVTAPGSTDAAGDNTAAPATLTGITSIPGDIVGAVGGAVLGPVEKSVASIAGTLLAVAAGLGLVVLGVFKTASPNGTVRQTVGSMVKTGEDVGEVAAA